jgi:hypothetical protein
VTTATATDFADELRRQVPSMINPCGDSTQSARACRARKQMEFPISTVWEHAFTAPRTFAMKFLLRLNSL